MVKNHHSVKKNGFTLIEILIVLVIISIMVSVTVMIFDKKQSSQRVVLLEDKLSAVIHAASERAILQFVVLSMHINKKGYQFYQLSKDAKGGESHWVRIQNDNLSNRGAFSGNIHIHLTIRKNKIGEKGNKSQNIIFWPNGEITPFTLRIKMSDLSSLLFHANKYGVLTKQKINDEQ